MMNQMSHFKNPSCENYFIEKRKEPGKCLKAIKRNWNLKKHIATLHSEDCWAGTQSSCQDLPLSVHSNPCITCW